MLDLTIGQVSGIIAAGTTVVQFLLPLALPFILLGLLHERNASVNASAASWSVIGRSFHSSHWPLILRTDSAATTSTTGVIRAVSWTGALVAILVGIAAIVTPLGLYDAIVPNNQPTAVEFHYIPDPSSMGAGTLPRKPLAWSRICSSFIIVPCPNSNTNLTTTRNSTSITVSGEWYNSSVSTKLVDLFQSGLANMEKSVSSMFDIESRTYSYSKSDEGSIPIDNGSSYPVSAYRQLDTLLLDDSITAIEGLIVDMKNGGIGFRNHSAPPHTQYGSVWTEELLFVVPETKCVNTNLTIDFTVPVNSTDYGKVDLTDRGGFVNFNTDFPPMDKNDTQNDPQLEFRAYRAAWFNNAWSMAFMNLTTLKNESTRTDAFEFINSTMGKTFQLTPDDSSLASTKMKAGSLSFESFGYYLSGTDVGRNSTKGFDNTTIPGQEPLYPNPFGINSTYFSEAESLCSSDFESRQGNINNFAAKCGLMYGAPKRDDDGSALILDPGSKWSVPLYACITATKATIKEVSFRFNGSDDASGLTITELQDKTYVDKKSMPVWGVENTNISVSEAVPLWGLVDPNMATDVNISTAQKESLWLPGQVKSLGGGTGYQNLPGVEFYITAIERAYSSQGYGGQDYSGSASLSMFRLWQDLSRSAETASKIPNLIWTDIAMNAVVGTKSMASPSSSDSSNKNNKVKRDGDDKPKAGPSEVLVTQYRRRIKYRVQYGIPAFIAVFVTACIAFSAVFLWVLGRATPAKMRKYLNETSSGRMLTYYSGNVDHQAENGKQWARSVGRGQYALGAAKTRPGAARTLDPAAAYEMDRMKTGHTRVITQESQINLAVEERQLISKGP